jgi:hypothetical protein
MFDSYPTYSPYRTLRYVKDDVQIGEDVYALQLAIDAIVAVPLVPDGVLGERTSAGIEDAQRFLGLEVDGRAGQLTQRGLALTLARKAHQSKDVPYKLLKGQLAHESSYLLGNYSAQRADDSFDAGVAQRNSNFHPLKNAFDPVDSIALLARHTRDKFDLFGVVTDKTRRWGLAAGAWNAPAFAHYLAGVKPWAVPSTNARIALENYITSVTAYL